MPHGHCSPQGPGQGAAACPRFPHGTCMGKLGHRAVTSQTQIGVSSWGIWAGSAGFGSWSSWILHYPLPQTALQRPVLEMELIFLTRCYFKL